MLALKVSQNHLYRGIELPNGQNAKISQRMTPHSFLKIPIVKLRNVMKPKENQSFVDRYFEQKQDQSLSV